MQPDDGVSTAAGEELSDEPDVGWTGLPGVRRSVRRRCNASRNHEPLSIAGSLPQRTRYGCPDTLLWDATWSMNDSAVVMATPFFSRASYLLRRWSSARLGEYQVPLRENSQREFFK